MRLAALATMPAAFFAGAAGTLGFRLLEGWAFDYELGFTSGLHLAVYAVLFVAPFVFFVVGIDPQRWDPEYRFREESRGDYRGIFIRAAVYFLGTFIAGYAL